MPASPPALEVSVVVPTYQRGDRLPSLVDTVLADPAVGEAVIVVDGSTDGSIEYLRARARADSRLVPLLTPNRGDSAARRAGVERASGDVVLLLDDDVVPAPGLAAGHARHHGRRAGLVVVGYMPVARRTGLTSELYALSYERVCREYEHDPDSILTGLWAGNVSLRRDDCLRVGPPASPGFVRGYHADRDFGLRCLAAGLHGVFDRSLRAEHTYERDLDEFLRDAYSSGFNRYRIHSLYPERIGRLRGDFYEEGLPGPSRRLLRLARRSRGRRLAHGLLRSMLAAARGSRLPRLERHTGYVLAAVEAQRGAIDAAAWRGHDAR